MSLTFPIGVVIGFSIGLPTGVLIAFAIMLGFLSIFRVLLHQLSK